VAQCRARLREFCLLFASESPLTLPQSGLQRHHDAIRELCMQASAPAVLARLRELAAGEPWFAKAYENLAAGSPTAACVTFSYMRRSRLLGLGQVLALDLIVAGQCQRHPDFPEGVRALLIDKTRDAAWSPPTYEGVTPALVEAFFTPL
jgi:enoyl-CoA hydratase/carnithine racemase